MLERLRRIASRIKEAPANPGPIGFPASGLRDSSELDRAAPHHQVDPLSVAPVMVVRTPSLKDQREEFLSLSQEDQDEQVRLHLAAVSNDSAIRPRFSDLLYAMGVIPADA